MHASSAERFAFGESTPDLTATDVPYGFDDDMWSLDRTNDPIDRARAGDSTQVNTVDRGLRVQWFVL